LLDQPPGIILTNYVSQSTAFIAALLCCLFLLNQDLSLQHRIYIGLAALVFLFNIFSISPARSGYLALPPALLFTGMCFFKQNKLPHLLGFMALSLALAFMSSSTLQQRVKQGLQEQSNYQTSPSETSVGVRMIFYTNTWELIQKKPVFGYGTSAFASSYGAYAAAKYQDWRGHATTDPHNQYLFIWLENGLLGLLIFAAYVVSALRYGMRYGSYGYIAAGLLVAISVSSLFNSHFKTYPEGNLIAFFLGALLAHQYPVQKNTGKQHA